MTTRLRPWKVASLVSSALLVGAFVAYRAGAFTSDAGPVAQPKAPIVFETAPGSVEFFGGSKSEAVIRVEGEPAAAPALPATTPAAKEAPSDDTFFGGSKSLIGLPRKKRPALPTEPAPLPLPTPSDSPTPSPSKPAPAPGA